MPLKDVPLDCQASDIVDTDAVPSVPGTVALAVVEYPTLPTAWTEAEPVHTPVRELYTISEPESLHIPERYIYRGFEKDEPTKTRPMRAVTKKIFLNMVKTSF